MESRNGWLGVLTFCACGAAFAATSADTQFVGAAAMLANWSQGSLGKTIRIAAMLVGAGLGIKTQKVVVPLSFGLVLYFGPNVVDEVFGAVA